MNLIISQVPNVLAVDFVFFHKMLHNIFLQREDPVCWLSISVDVAEVLVIVVTSV